MNAREKQYDELKMYSAVDLDVCLGDFYGHVGRHIYGFDCVYGG